MKLQGQNLSAETQGDDVKLLRNSLRQLSYSISETELQSTRRFVLLINPQNYDRVSAAM